MENDVWSVKVGFHSGNFELVDINLYEDIDFDYVIVNEVIDCVLDSEVLVIVYGLVVEDNRYI